MIRSLRLFLFIAFLSGLFYSCKNDLKIIAPYKEIPSVYAVLTPQEKIQVIRVNKVFLGEGNANDMAKVMDSVNYQPGEITIMLERYVNGVKTNATSTNNGHQTYILFRDSLIQTNEGAFNTNQRVYVSSDKLFTSGQYVLTVKNNHTNNTFTARANSIDSVNGNSGFPPFSSPYYPVPYNPSNPPYYYIDYSNQNVNYSIKSTTVSGAAMQDLTIRVHYYDSIVGGNKLYNSLDFVFYPQLTTAIQSDGKYNFSFKGENLFLEYGNILKNRPYPANFLGRKTYKVDYICYATTQDYYDYLQFAAPSLSFSQEKVLYSNFDNKAALGLFTFRSRCKVSKEMDNSFITQFAYSKYTCMYQFYTSALLKPGCP